MKKAIYKTKKMHCSSCEMLIEGDLEEMPGVKEAKSDYKKELTIVLFDEISVSHDQIIETIRKAGDYEVELLSEEVYES